MLKNSLRKQLLYDFSPKMTERNNLEEDYGSGFNNNSNKIELFIYEEHDLPTIREEKVDALGHCLEPKRLVRTVSLGSATHMARLSRTRSMPGSLKRSLSTRSSRMLQKYKITNDTHSDNLSNILSGLYAMFLVVLGASIPIAKVFAVDIAIQTLEGFYLYLFIVGILFILFVYTVVIHDMNPVRYIKQRIAARRKRQSLAAEAAMDEKQMAASIAENGHLDATDDGGETSSLQPPSPSVTSDGAFPASSIIGQRSSRMHFSFNTKSGSESFYLRLGAVAFGIGSVIHNGLEFGHFLEMTQSPDCQFDFVIIIRPIIQLIFTFTQLYFIFINSKLRIHRYCTVARFGGMHMIATNLCVWLRVITIETVREIHKFVPEEIGDLLGLGDASGDAGSLQHSSSRVNKSVAALTDHHHDGHKRAAPALQSHNGWTTPLMHARGGNCQQTSLMTSLLNSASPYLYPCAIEYCLIAAAILFIIWNNIDQPTQLHRSSAGLSGSAGDLYNALLGKRNRVSVDCSGANRGLFSGIFVLVLTIISIIVFFIFIDNADYVHLAVTVEHLSLIVLYSLALVAVLLAAFRFRDMKFLKKRERHLDETLLVLSLIGVYMFRIFSSIAGQYATDRREGSLVLAANIIITLQATIQTVFILNGLRRCARTVRQESRKPGREYVTFLLICNISIWATNTFEVLRSDANPASMSFYGPVPWSIITHVATPLTIFHQFHATVCLSTIWKTAYKLKAS